MIKSILIYEKLSQAFPWNEHIHSDAKVFFSSSHLCPVPFPSSFGAVVTSSRGSMVAVVAASLLSSHPPRCLCRHCTSLLPLHSLPRLCDPGRNSLGRSLLQKGMSYPLYFHNGRGIPLHFSVLVPPVLCMEFKSPHYTFLVHQCRNILLPVLSPPWIAIPFSWSTGDCIKNELNIFLLGRGRNLRALASFSQKDGLMTKWVRNSLAFSVTFSCFYVS